MHVAWTVSHAILPCQKEKVDWSKPEKKLGYKTAHESLEPLGHIDKSFLRDWSRLETGFAHIYEEQTQEEETVADIVPMEDIWKEEGPNFRPNLIDLAWKSPIHVASHNIVLEPVISSHVPWRDSLLDARAAGKLDHVHRAEGVVVFRDLIFASSEANSRRDQTRFMTDKHTPEQEYLVWSNTDKNYSPPERLAQIFGINHAHWCCILAESVVNGEADECVELAAQGRFQVRPRSHLCDVTTEFDKLFPDAILDVPTEVSEGSKAIVVEPIDKTWQFAQAFRKFAFLSCQMQTFHIIVKDFCVFEIAQEDVHSHENLSTLGSREAVKRALPEWENVPEKHQSSSHADPYCKGMLTREHHHDGVDAGELENVNKVGQPVIVEADKETS